MQAWVVANPAPIDAGPLRRVERELPEPGPGQVRVRVVCCGGCRPDLHLAEGDLPPRGPAVPPGQEVGGIVDALGKGASRFAMGERIGVAWLGRTDGSCRYCRRGAENLCTSPLFTGWTSTVATPTPAWPTSASPTGCRTPWTTNRPRRCCAPASS